MTCTTATRPVGIAYGVALLPMPGLIIVADGITRFTADNLSGRKGTSVMAGGELTFGGKFALRAGGGYDAVTGNGYGSAGASLVSEVAALDGGIRQDIFVDAGEPARHHRRRQCAHLRAGDADPTPTVIRNIMAARVSESVWRQRSRVWVGSGRRSGSPSR